MTRPSGPDGSWANYVFERFLGAAEYLADNLLVAEIVTPENETETEVDRAIQEIFRQDERDQEAEAIDSSDWHFKTPLGRDATVIRERAYHFGRLVETRFSAVVEFGRGPSPAGPAHFGIDIRTTRFFNGSAPTVAAHATASVPARGTESDTATTVFSVPLVLRAAVLPALFDDLTLGDDANPGCLPTRRSMSRDSGWDAAVNLFVNGALLVAPAQRAEYLAWTGVNLGALAEAGLMDRDTARVVAMFDPGLLAPPTPRPEARGGLD